MDQYRATRIANQICVSCDNSVSGTTFKSCDECRTERRRKRAKQVRDGRCNSCGKPRENLDLTLCKPCRDSQASRVPARRAGGLCSQCGKFPPIENKSTCATCTKLRVANFKKRYDKAQAEHLCPHCLKVPIEGGNFCAAYLAARKKYSRRLKDEVFAAYGGYICSCCGITEPMFLQIDHIDRDGYKLRKEQGLGSRLYGWLRRNNYPKGYQVLCANCNHARSRKDNPSGICLHKLTLVTSAYQAA